MALNSLAGIWICQWRVVWALDAAKKTKGVTCETFSGTGVSLSGQVERGIRISRIDVLIEGVRFIIVSYAAPSARCVGVSRQRK